MIHPSDKHLDISIRMLRRDRYRIFRSGRSKIQHLWMMHSEISTRKELELYLLCRDQPNQCWERLLSDESVSSENLTSESAALIPELHDMLQRTAIESAIYSEFLGVQAQIAPTDPRQPRIAEILEHSELFLSSQRSQIREAVVRSVRRSEGCEI